MNALHSDRNARVVGPSFTRWALLGVCTVLLVACSPSPHDVASRGEVDRLAAMLDEAPYLIEEQNDMAKTPLHYAVTYGKDESIALLIERGADVNAPDMTGMTALHMAASLDRVSEATLLLRAGAAVDAKDDFGDTPLHAAAIHGKVKMIDFLLENDASPTALNNDGKSPLDLARKQHKANAVERLERIGS